MRETVMTAIELMGAGEMTEDGAEVKGGDTIIREMLDGTTFVEGTVDALIDERATTHGDFARASVMVQAVKGLFRQAPNWHEMPPAFQEALDMMASKMGRVLYGDPEFEDHWADIAGYAQLVTKMLR